MSDQPIPYMERTHAWYRALGYVDPYRYSHFEEVPFVLPTVDTGQAWERVIDTICARSPASHTVGGTRYPLQGRSLALFRMDGERRQRRRDDAGETRQ